MREAIAPDLIARAQWVCWRYEGRGKSWTKVPYQINGRRADSTDRATWTGFEQAWAAYQGSANRFDGVGFVFAEDDPYFGIDLDSSLDDEGKPLPWAAAIIERFATRTEVSPSGKGVKLIGRGSLAGLAGNRKGHIETYDRDRYWTMTGRPLAGAPLEIGDRQCHLTAWHRETFPPRSDEHTP